MRRMVQSLKRFLRAEDGPTAVEYAVVIALIFLVCLAGIKSLGETTAASFQSSANALPR